MIIDFNCKYCNKICKNLNSLKQHECRCPKNPQRNINILPTEQFYEAAHKSRKGKPSWNKGLTAATDERVARLAEYNSQRLKGKPGRPQSEATKQKLRQYALEHPKLGHPFKHLVEYKGTWFDSTYEVEVVKSLDENNIRWEKCKRFAYHDLDGNLHYYTPDIYLLDFDVYLDPKNDFLINNINPGTGYSDVDKINWVMLENKIKIFILDKEHLIWDKIKQLMEEYSSG